MSCHLFSHSVLPINSCCNVAHCCQLISFTTLHRRFSLKMNASNCCSCTLDKICTMNVFCRCWLGENINMLQRANIIKIESRLSLKLQGFWRFRGCKELALSWSEGLWAGQRGFDYLSRCEGLKSKSKFESFHLCSISWEKMCCKQGNGIWYFFSDVLSGLKNWSSKLNYGS